MTRCGLWRLTVGSLDELATLRIFLSKTASLEGASRPLTPFLDRTASSRGRCSGWPLHRVNAMESTPCAIPRPKGRIKCLDFKSLSITIRDLVRCILDTLP
ncbi:uncharacterized protein LMH87_007564 [Akanthomyces muscarius]|uniref:Uncharacterized protein n=1 Tax=Akanthomyces muscarius TaxID=2231603 RepID=A0A9W8UNK6_AKAMU|nr:uncharacterized protein LMH87_007564 [Akanthomyces muscarius]KAJ4161528.1 hypothetical protein LMH87_007564 [Akanthomyces muscarius]